MKKYPADFTEEEKKFKDALDKAYENDDREPSRPLDLSFLEIEPERMQQATMIKNLLEVDDDFMDFVLGYMDLPPNVQLALQDLVKSWNEK